MTEQNLLVPLDTYLKVGLHIGTKYRSKYMEQFIYKVRQDGLAVLNVEKINERVSVMTKFVSQYNPEDIMVASRRENSYKAVNKFAEIIGAKKYTGRYPPGTLTNPNLKTFTEAKLLIVCDPWPDKNVINDAYKVGIPIIAFCDTNNESNYIDLVVPCNNKGKKSLALVFWILAREYLKNKGKIEKDSDFKYVLDDFADSDAE